MIHRLLLACDLCHRHRLHSRRRQLQRRQSTSPRRLLRRRHLRGRQRHRRCRCRPHPTRLAATTRRARPSATTAARRATSRARAAAAWSPSTSCTGRASATRTPRTLAAPRASSRLPVASHGRRSSHRRSAWRSGSRRWPLLRRRTRTSLSTSLRRAASSPPTARHSTSKASIGSARSTSQAARPSGCTHTLSTTTCASSRRKVGGLQGSLSLRERLLSAIWAPSGCILMTSSRSYLVARLQRHPPLL